MNDAKVGGPSVRVVGPLDVARFPWCTDAVVVSVTGGRGALRTARQTLPDYEYRTAVMLNDVPLVRSEGPQCPTCESMLATGYGIDEADSAEFRAVADAINSPYTGFADAIDRITPILGLLDDGVYAVAEASLYPSDGNGHFFWNVPNAFTTQPATGSPYVAEVDGCDVYDAVGGMPAYLYPSQPTASFDPSRVDHYAAMLDNRSAFPRAIAFGVGSLMAVLLDGHHKAAACALARYTVPTLVILPWTALTYPAGSYENGRLKPGTQPDKILFGGMYGPVADATTLTPAQISALTHQTTASGEREEIAVEETHTIDRAWPVHYASSWRGYPNVYDFAITVVAASQPFDIDRVDDWLAEPEHHAGNIGVAIRLLAGTDPARARELALQVARLRITPTLTLTALQALDAFHDDEADQVFIDEIVNNDDRRNPLRELADHHWDSLASMEDGSPAGDQSHD